MSPNVLVAPNRNKLIHYVLLAGRGCTHLVALYWFMVFIHETHVMPSSGKMKTKRHLFPFLLLKGRVCYTTSRSAYVAATFRHYISWWCLLEKNTAGGHLVASWNLKTHLFSFLLLAGRVCYTIVARIRNNFSQNMLCTNFLALYFMMVFIGENTGGAI